MGFYWYACGILFGTINPIHWMLDLCKIWKQNGQDSKKTTSRDKDSHERFGACHHRVSNTLERKTCRYYREIEKNKARKSLIRTYFLFLSVTYYSVIHFFSYGSIFKYALG